MLHTNFFDKKIIFSLWIVIIGILFSSRFQPQPISANEIAQIKATANLEQQARLYRQLIERVGPAQAQEDLFRSGLRFSGQTHLLNHTIGDYLYEKYGPAGLVLCKDYFLSSCYHGFVLHAIGQGGMTEVGKTLEKCRENGPTTLMQCTHAVGHGYLANFGYKNLLTALETCDKTAEIVSDFKVFNCYDGVFMENIWGVHDGSPSSDRWVHDDDPVYPCNDPRIDEKYLMGCWSNQPALAYQLFRGDISKVPAICKQIKNQAHQQMCYDGLARQIHPIMGKSITETLELCGLMPEDKWVDFCIVTNAASSFAVGDRDLPFELCANTRERNRSDCFVRLFNTMGMYVKDRQEFRVLCLKISDYQWRNECVSSFRR